MPRDRGARGQATMELALVLPVLLMLLLLLIQVGLVVRDQIIVVNAARAGARAAAVEPSLSSVRGAVGASGALDAEQLDVGIGHSEAAGTVTVTVTYRSVTDVPLIGPLLGDVTISESTTMRLETLER